MKEIMVNGVNVCECNFYTKNNCNCSIFWTPCEELDTCYYKQLKRLEQENEKLKARIKEIGEKMGFLNADRCSEIMRYKQTLEEIREMAKHDCEYECANSNENCTIESCLEKRIQRKINEVLK